MHKNPLPNSYREKGLSLWSRAAIRGFISLLLVDFSYENQKKKYDKSILVDLLIFIPPGG